MAIVEPFRIINLFEKQLKVYNHLNEFTGLNNPVVTIGIFDGVHLGHEQIIRRIVETAKKTDGNALLLSFFPHPRAILQPQSELRLLNTLDEKINLLNKNNPKAITFGNID